MTVEVGNGHGGKMALSLGGHAGGLSAREVDDVVKKLLAKKYFEEKRHS